MLMSLGNRRLVLALCSAILAGGADLATASPPGARGPGRPVPAPAWYDNALDRCNVTWDKPSTGPLGSMPIGNGDIGLNVWVEEGGDLLFYVSKTDAWSENARLLKLGRVRIRLSPNPFAPGMAFRQQLRLQSGQIVIQAGHKASQDALRIWVDANHPVVYVDIAGDAEGRSPLTVQASLEMWRTGRRELKGNEMFSAYGLKGSPQPVFVEPDRVVEGPKDRIVWYHRNERSIWADNLKLQGLGGLIPTLRDPLLGRTFGGTLRGEGMVRTGPASLSTVKPVRQCRIAVYALTRQTDSAEAWQKELDSLVATIEASKPEQRLAAHQEWWADFWNRSWVYARGDAEADAVTQGYALQRLINACAGRGQMPIKFNGSIFTVDAKLKGEQVDADYRNWGGPYWFQNTRLPYWSMLAAGDFDLMQPLWRMYLDTLPLAKARTQAYYRHEGAFWPETMYFWGTYVNDNYGWDRRGKPDGLTDNRYIRYHWEGGLELATMMLDYYAMTQDQKFLQESLLPVANPIITFYDKHYARDGQGKIRLWPAQSLETYWDSVNPAPEIAGLRFVLKGLLALPDEKTRPGDRQQWRRVLRDLPPLPMRQAGAQTVLGFAEKPGPKHNAENPELYAVFPFRLFGLGKPELDLALRTLDARVHKGTGGWQQDAIQAALLGRSEEAAKMVAANFSRKNPECRFPAFWGPNFDWTPDQDHGCAAMIALQRMLLQSDDGKIRLLPAWPKRWDVRMKLHGPEGTTVTAEYCDGVVRQCKVTPAERTDRLVFPGP